MVETMMTRISFKKAGCTNGDKVFLCSKCKLVGIECTIFKDCTDFKALYGIEGEF